MSAELTARWWRDGYSALARLRRASGDADEYAARVLGRPALVVRSRELVERFYDEDWVLRRGAVPVPLARLLFGGGAVHGLDGADHRHRKGQFLDVLDEPAAHAVGGLARRHLDKQLAGGSGDAFDLLARVYGRAVLEWTGVAVPEGDYDRLSRDLAAIVHGFGGHAYLSGWRARLRCNRWARGQIRRARAEGERATPLSRIAHWCDPDGGRLPEPVAAVELLNVLRPTVAVAYFGAFALHALALRPDARAAIAANPARAEAFAQEVRRSFPFVPALAAVTRRAGDWAGRPVPAGRRIVLDVLGVDHDPARHHEPDTFEPNRFAGGLPGPYDLVPHGGGHPESGHRCPGERLAVVLLTETVTAVAAAPVALTSRGWDDARIPAKARVHLEPR